MDLKTEELMQLQAEFLNFDKRLHEYLTWVNEVVVEKADSKKVFIDKKELKQMISSISKLIDIDRCEKMEDFREVIKILLEFERKDDYSNLSKFRDDEDLFEEF